MIKSKLLNKLCENAYFRLLLFQIDAHNKHLKEKNKIK